jgi:hypothetical protein
MEKLMEDSTVMCGYFEHTFLEITSLVTGEQSWRFLNEHIYTDCNSLKQGGNYTYHLL